jgi:hypothetical protein
VLTTWPSSQATGKIDRVYSAAQDSDFLLYDGMGDIIYDLKTDGSFHSIDLERDVLGQVVGQCNLTTWQRWQFVVFSAACGCDYIDNPVNWGITKLYKLVSDNLTLAEDALIALIASKAKDAASSYNMIYVYTPYNTVMKYIYLAADINTSLLERSICEV